MWDTRPIRLPLYQTPLVTSSGPPGLTCLPCSHPGVTPQPLPAVCALPASAGLTWPRAPSQAPFLPRDFPGHCGVGCSGATQHPHLGNPECGKAIPMCIQELALNSSFSPRGESGTDKMEPTELTASSARSHNASPCIFSPSFFPGLLFSLIPTSPGLHSSTKDQYDSTSDSVFWRPGLKYPLWGN